MLFKLSCKVFHPASVQGNESESTPHCVLSATVTILTDNVSSNSLVSMSSMNGERTLHTCSGSRLFSLTISRKR